MSSPIEQFAAVNDLGRHCNYYANQIAMCVLNGQDVLPSLLQQYRQAHDRFEAAIEALNNLPEA